MVETPARGRALRQPEALAFLWDTITTWQFALAVIVIFGAVLRFHGLGWDKPAGAETPLQMHPDERFLSFVANDTTWPSSVSEYFDTQASPLNPYNAPNINAYVYGTFPMFLVKGVDSGYRALPGWGRDGLGFLGVNAPGGESKYDTNVVWGRRITAFTDTLTILLVFGLGLTLFGRGPGLLGAFLYACAVLPTQLSHFWAMDPYVTFFATGTLLLSALSVTATSLRRQWWLAVLLGVVIGLGLASKVTAWPLVVVPVLAFAARIALRDMPVLGLRWRGKPLARSGHWANDISFLCVSLAVGMIVFRVAQPYAFAGPNFWDMGLNPQWKADLTREIDFQNGNVDFPPFVQWASRPRLIWPLQNLLLWGTGPALGFMAFGSMAAGAFLMFKRRELSFLLPLALAASILGFQGPRFVAWMRYFVPMYPVLCAFAAWAMVAILTAARGRQGWFANDVHRFTLARRQIRIPGQPLRTGAVASVFLVLLATTWWAMAFQSVYNHEHTRIQASRWIYANVPAGASLTSELWDDSLPYTLPGTQGGIYTPIETEPFQPDTPTKVNELIFGWSRGDKRNLGLNGADYVVISSHRVRGAIVQLEREYPATIRYYELLDSGALGFDLVAHFEERPSFLGVTIDDSGADESFTVYDHPEVSIYKKSDRWDAATALALLNEAHPERAVNLLPRQGRTNGLQFTPAEAAIQQAGGTFSEVFDTRGWASSVPWLWWFLWLELAAFAAVPWLTWLFRALPDKGYGLSKIAGFAGVGAITWALVAWNAVHFSGELSWAVAIVWLAAGVSVGVARWPALRTDARDHWRSWLAAEVVFAAAFAAFLLLRAYNPDVWHHPQGGEKPMELAYLTAVTRSTILPPYDPWFSGGTMNYYYMGWFLLSVPIRALRIVPEIAFNLAIPTFAAIGATTAYSTVHNLVGLSSRARDAAKGGVSAARPLLWPALIAGMFAAVLLIGIGNLDGLHQTIERFQQLNETQGGGFHWGFAHEIPFIGGFVGFLSGVKQVLFDDATLRGFDWWRSSRVHIGQFDITEFPFWSLLFADLHPHLMGLPFFGLLISLGLGYVATAVSGDRRRGWILAGLLGVALGLVRTIHTWDFPSAVLITVASVALGQACANGRWQTRWWFFVGHLVLAAGILTVLFAPYTAHFEVFNSGIMMTPETTKANQYFAHFGVFVAFALAFLAVRYHEELRERDGDPGRNPLLAVVAGRWEVLALGVFLAGLTAFTWRFGLTTLALSIAAELFLLGLLWLEFQREERDIARIFATGCFAMAIGIAAGTDVVVVKNDIVRMNTVFKFLLQSWQLYAIASAYAAWYVGRALWVWDGIRPRAVPGRRLAAFASTAVLVVLVFGASIYLWSGTRARQEARFVDTGPTLNGFAFFPGSGLFDDHGTHENSDDVEIKLADDRPLIDWLRNNVEGSPVIAEAVGPLYHWTGRMSWNTGLPAVIGWDWHQTQQRWDYSNLIQQRRAETQRFYADADQDFAREYIDKYNVRYVIVGTEEYVYGTKAAVDKFAAMPSLREVFRSGRYAIYEVS